MSDGKESSIKAHAVKSWSTRPHFISSKTDCLSLLLLPPSTYSPPLLPLLLSFQLTIGNQTAYYIHLNNMARYIHYAFLLLLVIILCNSCSVVAFTSTPPLYKTNVISPKPNAVFKAGKPITLKVQHIAPQGMRSLWLD